MSIKQYRDMSHEEQMAWGRAELEARKLDLRTRGAAGLAIAKANAVVRRKAIGATYGQAADMCIQASRANRRGEGNKS